MKSKNNNLRLLASFFIMILSVSILTLIILPIKIAAGEEAPVDIDLAQGGGYWVTYADGDIDTYSGAPNLERVWPDWKNGNEQVVSLVPAASGYWIVGSNGHVQSAGGALELGDLSNVDLNREIIAAVPTISGLGYYLLGSDGGIFSFGDARFYGSVQGLLDKEFGSGVIKAADWLTAPIVTMATTSVGYWLISADGSVFSFGNAIYHGSIQDVVDHEIGPGVAAKDWLEAPIVDIVPSAAGLGYLMLASDGGVFNFGISQFHGSLAGKTESPSIAVAVKSDRSGYLIVTGDSQVWPLGDIVIDSSIGIEDANSCRITGLNKTQYDSHSTAGFPLAANVAHSRGVLKVATVFIDFSDKPAHDSKISKKDKEQLREVEKYLETMSYGQLDVKITRATNKWLRARLPWIMYSRLADTGTVNISPYSIKKEVYYLADQYLNLDEYDVVLTIHPDMFFSGGTAAIWNESINENNIKTYRFATVNTQLLQTPAKKANAKWWKIAAHELAHTFGLADLYPYDETDRILAHTGHEKKWATVQMGLMNLEGSILIDISDSNHNAIDTLPRGFLTSDFLFVSQQKPREMLAWSRWQLDWLAAHRIRCVSGEVANAFIILDPVASKNVDGIAMVAIPLGETEIIVAEVRRKIGYDKPTVVRKKCCGQTSEHTRTIPTLTEEGVFLYIVDTSKDSGNLPIKFAGDSGNGQLDKYPALKVGEGRVWNLSNGKIIKIMVEEERESGFAIRVERE